VGVEFVRGTDEKGIYVGRIPDRACTAVALCSPGEIDVVAWIKKGRESDLIAALKALVANRSLDQRETLK
jgi:hypothetical protein